MGDDADHPVTPPLEQSAFREMQLPFSDPFPDVMADARRQMDEDAKEKAGFEGTSSRFSGFDDLDDQAVALLAEIDRSLAASARHARRIDELQDEFEMIRARVIGFE